MGGRMKLVRVILIVLLILIIIVAVNIIFINLKNDKGTSESNTITEFEQKNTYIPEEKLEKVKNSNKYYTVETLVERYINYIKDLKGEEIDEELREITTTALVSILDEKYKNEFKITEENLLNNYEDIKTDEVVQIDDIYMVEKSASSNLFLIYGTLIVAQKDFQLMVRTDSYEMTFSIFPEEYIKKNDYSYENEVSDFDSIFSNELKANEYNKFRYITVSKERMVVKYFNDFKKKILLNFDTVYDLLDEEYRNKRFESKENFNKYVQNNERELSQIELKEYNVNTYEDYREYICKDQFNNIYEFKETAIEEYTVILDTYTLESEEFTEEYNNANEQNKVLMNIDKWIDMLNNRDYKTAYSVLDETFRENNFGSEDKFEEYMREHFPLHYKLSYDGYEKQTQNHVQEIVLTDITGETQDTVETTIVMKLGEGTEFVMSFNME